MSDFVETPRWECSICARRIRRQGLAQHMKKHTLRGEVCVMKPVPLDEPPWRKEFEEAIKRVRQRQAALRRR